MVNFDQYTKRSRISSDSARAESVERITVLLAVAATIKTGAVTLRPRLFGGVW